MARVNMKDVEARISRLNQYLGIDDSTYSVPGALVLGAANDSYTLARYANNSGGVHTLFGPDSLKAVDTFVRGMFEGAELMDPAKHPRIFTS